MIQHNPVREAVYQLLVSSEAAVAEAILALYAFQTEDERQAGTTNERNGRGFNHDDSNFLTSIAKALPKWRNHMTPRQLAAARRMLPKYWRQLAPVFADRLGSSAEPVPAALPIPFEPKVLYPTNANFGIF